MHRKAVQIGQARVAGAEIVDRQAHAHRTQLGQPAQGLVLVTDQHRLGQLQLQAMRRQTVARQRRRDTPGKVAATELHRRDIDRDHQLRPGRGLPAGLVEHPVAQRHDQAAFLCHRNEALGRGRHRGVGQAPAQQRLDAGDAAVAQPALRLELEPEVALAQRAGTLAVRSGLRHDGHELVAGQAKDTAGLAQAGAHALGHRAQQPVAQRVTMGVVDLLELVQVEIEHGQRRERPGTRRGARPSGAGCARSRTAPSAWRR